LKDNTPIGKKKNEGGGKEELMIRGGADATTHQSKTCCVSEVTYIVRRRKEKERSPQTSRHGRATMRRAGQKTKRPRAMAARRHWDCTIIEFRGRSQIVKGERGIILQLDANFRATDSAGASQNASWVSEHHVKQFFRSLGTSNGFPGDVKARIQREKFRRGKEPR